MVQNELFIKSIYDHIENLTYDTENKNKNKKKLKKYKFNSQVSELGFYEELRRNYTGLYQLYFGDVLDPINDKNEIINVLNLPENKNRINPKSFNAIVNKIKSYKRKNELTEYIIDIVLPLLYSKESKLSLPKIKKINIVKTLLLDIQPYTTKNPNKKNRVTGVFSTDIKPHHYRKFKVYNKYTKQTETETMAYYTFSGVYQIDVVLFDSRNIKKFEGKVLYAENYDKNGKTKPNYDYNYIMDSVFSNFIGDEASRTSRVIKENNTYVKTNYMLLIQRAYIQAFSILKVNDITDSKTKNPLYDNLMNIEMISRYNKYINTEFDFSQTNFYNAIRNKNYIPQECIINAFTDHYKNTLMSDNKRNKLTREKIIKLMKITEEEFVKNGSSIESMEPIFIEYKIRARIYDHAVERILYRYDPEIFDRHIPPFCCMVKNGHIYVLNNNLKSLNALTEIETDKNSIVASHNFYINNEISVPQHKMISNIDDIINIHKMHVDQQFDNNKYNLVLLNITINKILFDIYKSGYEPEIIFKNGKVDLIKIKSDDILFIIQEQRLIKYAIKENVRMDNEDEYNISYTLLEKLKANVFTRENLSYYSELDIDILNKYRTISPLGLLQELNDDDNDVEIDVSKAYTFQFSDITQIPIFSIFDKFVKYNNEVIQDFNLYIIESYEENILFHKKNMLLYGVLLKRLDIKLYKIFSVKTPSNIKNVDFKKYVSDLWATDISEDVDLTKSLKKLIMNVVIGTMSKSKSELRKSYLFNSIEEAKSVQETSGGTINSISEYKIKYYRDSENGIVYNNKDEIVIEDVFKDDQYSYQIYNEGQTLYILTISDKAELNNGYRYIAELIIQKHNYYMYDCFKKLEKAKIVVKSVKIDAFTIPMKNLKKAKKILLFHSSFGNWSYKSDFSYPTLPYKSIENNNIEIEATVNNNVNINNEFNTQNICNIIIELKNMLILGNTPGAGKSYIASAIKLNKLFVVPTNKLVCKYRSDGYSAVTINKFFSISINKEKYIPFDYSEFECIIFDEIYFNNVYVLSRINNFVNNNINLVIVATGDVLQLKSVSEISNNVDEKDYLNKCIYSIFNNIITLKINKRFKNPEDHLKLVEIKNYIYSDIFNLEKLIKLYFKYTDDINLCINNIAYTNNTCNLVAKEIRKNKNIKEEYIIGEVLVNRKYIRGFSVNYEYVIHSINNATFVLKNIDSDELHTLNIKNIRESFIFSYCVTGHCVQGSTLKGSICIFDYKMHFVSLDWLYVVITRAENLEDIYFYKKK